jgi:hypothetical protein
MENSHVLEHASDNVHVALLLQLSVFTVVGGLLMLLAPLAPWSIKLLLIALVFLTLKRWGGVLVLVLVQCDLLLREGLEFPTLTGSGGILFVLTVISVLMFVARQRMLLQQIASNSVFSLAREFFSPTDYASTLSSAGEPEPGPQSANGALRIISSALRGVTLLFVCVIVARALLLMVPRNRELTGRLRELVNLDPAMWAATGLLVSLAAIWIVFSEISWRQLTAAQARMYLRSTFVKAHYRDLRMIVMRRINMRKKQLSDARTRKDTHSKSQPPDENTA